MKNQPKNRSLCRAARIPAVAFFSLGLGFSLATAQDSQSTPSSQSPTAPNNPNNSSMTPAETGNGTSDTTAASGSDTASADSLHWGDRRFLKKVAKGSEEEVALAQLAQQRSSNEQVKQYAQMLATDHEKMNHQLEQLAQRKGVEISKDDEMGGSAGTEAGAARGTGNYGQTGTPATTGAGGATTNGTSATTASNDSDMPGHRGMKARHEDRKYRELEAKSGSDFDRAYLSAMVDDHQKDVKMFKKEAEKADDQEVRSFASAQVSTLQQHLIRAQALMTSTAAE
jgi:putative membrane protein